MNTVIATPARRTARMLALTAASAAALTCTLTPFTAQAAQAPAAAPVASYTESNKPVVTRVDVDGDGRTDTTRLERTRLTRDSATFRISTTTARKRSFSTSFTVPNYGQNPVVSDAHWGMAGVDGVRGAEIIVDRSGGVGDFPSAHVYTVRNNRWVALKAPGVSKVNLPWSVANHPLYVAGYDFSMVRGERRVVATSLQKTAGTWENPVYGGTRTTYRWSNSKGWVKSSTQKVTKVADAQAQKWSGFNGLIWR